MRSINNIFYDQIFHRFKNFGLCLNLDSLKIIHYKTFQKFSIIIHTIEKRCAP